MQKKKMKMSEKLEMPLEQIIKQTAAPIPKKDSGRQTSTVLKVSGDSKPQKTAGAIAHHIRSHGRARMLAGGNAAMNQAIKAVAIARKYLGADDTPTDLHALANFNTERGRNLALTLIGTSTQVPAVRVSDRDLRVTATTNPHKLAGAIAGRVRDSEPVALVANGAEAVGIMVRAIPIGQEYLREDGVSALAFRPTFIDLERGGGTSTFLHCAVQVQQTNCGTSSHMDVDTNFTSRTVHRSSRTKPTSKNLIATELQKLADLLNDGLLTEEEFAAAKQKLLS